MFGKKKEKIKLGNIVKDVVTGFEGHLTSIHTFLHNVNRGGVQPTELKDGLPQDAYFVDMDALRLVGDGKASEGIEPSDQRDLLGKKVKDPITGLTGVVTEIGTWLFGCRRCTVSPDTMHDGKPLDNVGYDSPRLELVPDVKPVESKGERSTGGPQKPLGRPTPSR